MKATKLIVFTDLDETLLDGQTYQWGPAESSLEELRRREVDIVLVSSKTFSEMIPIHNALRLRTPFVLENGGGIALMAKSTIEANLPGEVLAIRRTIDDWSLVVLGTEYGELVAALASIAAETGIILRGFASMSQEEIAQLTGLPVVDVERARSRNFDEPFMIVEPDREKSGRVIEAAGKRGISVVQGGRFWHLMGHGGKGKAVSVLIDGYRKSYGAVHTVGLGDGPNDFPFLAVVDTAFLLGGTDRFPVPHNLKVRPIPRTGPEGWNEAMLAFLSEWDVSAGRAPV